jgi:aspartokinase
VDDDESLVALGVGDDEVLLHAHGEDVAQAVEAGLEAAEAAGLCPVALDPPLAAIEAVAAGWWTTHGVMRMVWWRAEVLRVRGKKWRESSVSLVSGLRMKLTVSTVFGLHIY